MAIRFAELGSNNRACDCEVSVALAVPACFTRCVRVIAARSGLLWHEYSMFFRNRFRIALSIAFAFVATHNHFVLDRGGKVFKQSAPVIKLPVHAAEEDHLGLLGLLNSSTACFWMKQVFHNKGGGGIGGGLATEEWEQFYEFDGTKLQRFPLPKETPLNIAQVLDSFAIEWAQSLPAALAERGVPSAMSLNEARARAREIRQRMIALQEELDWRCYQLYGVTGRRLLYACGRSTRDPHRATRLRDGTGAKGGSGGGRDAMVRAAWLDTDYRNSRALAFGLSGGGQETDRDHRDQRQRGPDRAARVQAPLEQRAVEAQQERALRGWLLDRLEAPSLSSEPHLTTTAALADRMRDDEEFLRVAELYAERPDFDVAGLVSRLAEDESVPLLPVLRYKPSESGSVRPGSVPGISSVKRTPLTRGLNCPHRTPSTSRRR